jgi:hypothetical protein
MTSPAILRRRRPPVRIVLGERIRLHPKTDQAIAASAALDHRSFEKEAALWLRRRLGA